jgi:hypothetical protein
MAERIGANGLPMNKKIVTWEELQAQNSETETLQEILEVNPNHSDVEPEVEEIEEDLEDELEDEDEEDDE